MNCEDVREWTAAGFRTIGLTELALAETHLRQCAECRDSSRPRQIPPPPERSVSLTALRSHFVALRSIAPTLTARAGAVAGEAVRRGGRLSTRARVALVDTARAGAGALHIMPGLRARAGDLRARLHATLSMPLPPPARLMWLGLLATLAIYAGHTALHLPAESPIDADGETTLAAVPSESPAQFLARPGMESATGTTIESIPAAEPERSALGESESGVPSGAVSVARPEPEARQVAESPARASVQKKPEPAQAPPTVTARVETADPQPPPRRMTPLAHVAGRLSVKNRSAVEQDLTELLTRTGGTLVGTDQDGAVMFVDAVVPQSAYEEFMSGLTRIGSWRVEAERSPLPEDVHVTIRVGG